MNILYVGRYNDRFRPVIDQIKKLPKNALIVELCFGDTRIAHYCRENGYKWKGIDLNRHFVERAKKLGYDAYFEDLSNMDTVPHADACVMIGSLYHFHAHVFSLLKKMLTAANQVIISEPVINLSSQHGVLGFLAKRSANTGKGEEKFRYNKSSFLSMLKQHSVPLNYSIESVGDIGKDLVVKLIKKEND